MSPETPGPPLVGILGGMGPAATADFYAKLIQNTPAQRDQDHLRVVIWADPTVPDRVTSVRDGASDAYPALLHGTIKLRDAGATLAAMPCHTAHHFIERLHADSGLRFVDMVEETVSAVVRRSDTVRRVGLVATDATLTSGLYQGRLYAADLEVLVPAEETQIQVAEAIRLVKANHTERAATLISTAVEHLCAAGADIVVLACTELPLAVSSGDGTWDNRILDATDVLAAAVVRESGRYA